MTKAGMNVTFQIKRKFFSIIKLKFMLYRKGLVKIILVKCEKDNIDLNVFYYIPKFLVMMFGYETIFNSWRII